MVLAYLLMYAVLVQAQSAPAGLADTVTTLGSFDFDARIAAAQQIRRLPAEVAVPALRRAVAEHPNSYTRFRAFVILTGIDTEAADQVAHAVLSDRDDRLRTVAYQWFEQHPDRSLAQALIAALAREGSEFVRPALVRALAALGDVPAVRSTLTPLVLRGEDLFRGAVITALGEHGGRYAYADILSVAKLDGPLQDSAIIALGLMGESAAGTELASLQASGPREAQPAVSAALCLLGFDCAARMNYLRQALTFARDSDEHRALFERAASAVGVLARAERAGALDVLLDLADGAPERAREALSIALATVALRHPPAIIAGLEARRDVAQVGELLLEGFDMLTEDFDEEQCFAALRRAYWTAPDGSARRIAIDALLKKLEF